ncbi:Aldo/keto reductase [Nannochloropsis gaditana]|uniref:Aldo/keto reductase n=1 Tax=Nannochloropsis gaditana TaxID=72520 RepID=W7TS62_9STRA|nr:Aldo/keto reductase [Nannochloropsis gaditana]
MAPSSNLRRPSHVICREESEGRESNEDTQPSRNSSMSSSSRHAPDDSALHVKSPFSGQIGTRCEGGRSWFSMFAAVCLVLLVFDRAPGAEAVNRGLRKRRSQTPPEPPTSNATTAMDSAITVKLPAVPPFKVGRISVPHSDLTLSRIAYGSLHFPEFKDNVTGLTAALEACQKVGVTTIDLADVYGWIEDGHGAANDIFAEALKASPGLRSKLELVTKFGIRLSGGYHIDLSPEWIHESLDRYLTLFDTDYVDVLMIHNPDPNMDVQAVAQAFKEIKEARKARAFGISNFHQWEYEALRDAMAAEGLKLSVHEMETSVLHPDRITDDTVSYFSTGENELRILGWGALGGDPYGGSNLLFGSEGEREKRIVETLALKGQELALEEDAGLGKKQTVTFGPDEVAVAWLLHHPGNIVPIIGTTAVARLMAQTTPAEKIPFRDLDFDDIMSALHY